MEEIFHTDSQSFPENKMKLINWLPSLHKMLDISTVYYLINAVWTLQSCWLLNNVA